MLDNICFNKNIYYSIEPIKKWVTEEEFKEFLKNYPRKLECDVCGISEPPMVSYNDFELADRWPFSIVASAGAGCYCIVTNYQELFNSKYDSKNESSASENEDPFFLKVLENEEQDEEQKKILKSYTLKEVTRIQGINPKTGEVLFSFNLQND